MTVSEEVYLRIRTYFMLERITCKQDLLYMDCYDFERVIAEALRRTNHHVDFSDRFGEGNKGLVIDKKIYATLYKCGLNARVNVEQAMKLAKSMAQDAIQRGIIFSLGDFDGLTRKFCHKNVITCVNGDGLLQLCLDAKKNKLFNFIGRKSGV